MQNKSILIVDDDRDLQSLISAHLTREGFHVMNAYSGEHALEVIEARGLPHVALVDIYMPGQGGLEFCRRLHEFSDVPVVMLTAEADSDVVVGTIQLYAEDYIVKPFNMHELVARVQRLLWRIPSYEYAADQVISVDDLLSVDFGHQRVEVEGKTVPLTPTETKLLHILLNNVNQVVQLEFLLNRIWPREEVYEDTLRVHIHRLRQKIENKQTGRTYIITERGQGYRFHVGEMKKARSRS